MAYNLPKLSDSPIHQLMSSLPQILMRLKENQQRQSNQDRQFQAQQQQQTKAEFWKQKEFDETNRDQETERKYQADRDWINDYKKAENDPWLQESYIIGLDRTISGFDKNKEMFHTKKRQAMVEEDRRLAKRESEAKSDYWEDVGAYYESNRGKQPLTATQEAAKNQLENLYEMKFDTLKMKTAGMTSDQVDRGIAHFEGILGKKKGGKIDYYDDPINIERWDTQIRKIYPKVTIDEMNIIIDAMADNQLKDEDIPLLIKNILTRQETQQVKNPLLTNQFSGEFQAGTQFGELLKRGAKKFGSGFEKFNVESFRK